MWFKKSNYTGKNLYRPGEVWVKRRNSTEFEKLNLPAEAQAESSFEELKNIEGAFRILGYEMISTVHSISREITRLIAEVHSNNHKMRKLLEDRLGRK